MVIIVGARITLGLTSVVVAVVFCFNTANSGFGANADDLPAKADTNVWIGVVIFFVGMLGFLNFMSLRRIWGGLSSGQEGRFALIGLTSMCCLFLGGWLLITTLLRVAF